LHHRPIAREIQAARNTMLAEFRKEWVRFRTSNSTIRRQIAEALFESYEIDMCEDRAGGNFFAAGDEQSPQANRPANVWAVLTPTCLSFVTETREYKAISWINEELPKPRFFDACPDGSELSRLDVQG